MKAIISRLLDSDRAMISFLFETEVCSDLRDHPDNIVASLWELGEEQQRLVRGALDLWSGNGNVFLWELTHGLSPENLSRLIRALESWRGLHDHMDSFQREDATQIYE